MVYPNRLQLSLHMDDITPCCGRIWHWTLVISATSPVHQCIGTNNWRHRFQVGLHPNIVKLELLPVFLTIKQLFTMYMLPCMVSTSERGILS